MKEIIDQIIEIDTLAFENKTKNEQIIINKKQEYENMISGYRDEMLSAAKKKSQSIAEETETFIMENEKSLQEQIQKTSAQLDKDYLKAEKELVQKYLTSYLYWRGNMNPNMAFYAVNTKIVTKKGRILNSKDWNKFIESTSIEQLADLLKSNLEFGKAFEDVVNSENERVNLETVLSRFRKIEIENLLHYFSGDYKEFLKTFLMEEEINDLSLILRKLSRGESLEGIKDRFVHSDLFATLDFEDLITVKSIEELTKKLKNTIYYNGLRNLTSEDALKREFHIEMKLYVVLYKTIIEAAEKLDKEDFKAVKEIMGLKVDLLNTQWIFRALKYYSIKPEEIFIYSLEGGRKIGYDKLRNLCYSKSLDEFKKMVSNYLEYDLFKDLNDAEIDINVVIDSYMFNCLKNKSYHNVGVAISFIYLLDTVINDLTSITEGIQYNVPKEKLKGYLAYKI